MDIPTHGELVERIDAFLERTGMAPSRLGRDATGEPNLIASIRNGRSPSLETLNRLARVMNEHDPETPPVEAEPKAEWPLQSANNGSEIITAAPVPGAEAGPGAPFARPSSRTCSATSAPPPPSPDSPASSAGEEIAA